MYNHCVVTQTSLARSAAQTSNQRGKIKQTDAVVSRVSMWTMTASCFYFYEGFTSLKRICFRAYVINAPPGLNTYHCTC